MGIQNLSGQTFGQYELRNLLGAGGMGAVYRGYQISLKREVAIKILSPELAQDSGHIERFNREAETSARLEHRHIIPIHDYGTEGNISYVVMRLLTGGTLSERIDQSLKTGRSLPSMGEVAELLDQLTSALDYAHSQDVIHRDIKPSNIMFDNQGSAYIVDFGIAKLLQASQSLTGTGMTMGTPTYMAPEQWKAEGISAATDQYALGVMTYAVVTGQVPFEAETPYALMNKHINETPTPPQVLRADIPPAVSDVLNRAMAKSDIDRFPTCTAFAQAFRKAVSGQTGKTTSFFTAPMPRKRAPTLRTFVPGTPSPAAPARASSTSPPMDVARKAASSRRWLWGVATVIAAVLAVVIFMVLGQGGNDEAGTDVPALAAAETLTAAPDLQATADAMLSDRLTETAISWTQTPTPDLELTAEAMAFTVLTETGAAPTSTLEPSEEPTYTLTFTPEPTNTLTPTVEPTETPMPTETLTPTDEPTNTPTAEPNRVPTFERIAGRTMQLGETVSVAYDVSDPDGDELTVTASVRDPDIVSATINTPGSVDLTAHAAGSTVVTLAVTDGRGGRYTTSFFVTVLQSATDTPEVSPTEANRFPVLERIAGQVMNTGETISVPYAVSDPDGDELTVTASVRDPDIVSATITTPGSVDLTAHAAGSTVATLVVTDGRGGKHTTSFFVTVLQSATDTPEVSPTEANRFPVFERIAGQVMNTGETISVPYAVSDPDGDELTVTASVREPDIVSATINTPGSVDLTAHAAGSTVVTLVVTDGRGGKHTTSFFVTVLQSESEATATAVAVAAGFEGPVLIVNVLTKMYEAPDVAAEYDLIYSDNAIPITGVSRDGTWIRVDDEGRVGWIEDNARQNMIEGDISTVEVINTATPYLAVIYTEDFEQGGMTGWQFWEGNVEVIEVDGNHVLSMQSTGDDIWPYARPDQRVEAVQGDYSMSVRVNIVQASSEQGFAEAITRVRETENSIVFSQLSSYGYANIGHVVAGEWVSIDDANFTAQVDHWYDMRVDVVGEQVRVFLDGRLFMSATIEGLAQAGGISFGTAPNAILYLDDIVVRSLDTSPDALELTAQGTITANVNVRSGPGTEYDTLVGANQGETVFIMAWNADQTWAFIRRDQTGEQGWVSVDFIAMQ